MDSPDQGATGILVSSTTVSGDSVVFAIASIEVYIKAVFLVINPRSKGNGARVVLLSIFR
jgi:hypothetical protein